MPKRIIDYSKTIIYKIVCKDTEIKDVYVGSTTQFTKRKASHKSACHNKKDWQIYMSNVYLQMNNNYFGRPNALQRVIGRVGNRFYKDTIIEVKNGTETEIYIIVTGYVQKRSYIGVKPTGQCYDIGDEVGLYINGSFLYLATPSRSFGRFISLFP
jgi:predicted GIY-YIG superfamily endonuclease